MKDGKGRTVVRTFSRSVLSIRLAIVLLGVVLAKDWALSGASELDFPYRSSLELLLVFIVPIAAYGVARRKRALQIYAMALFFGFALLGVGDPSILLGFAGVTAIDTYAAASARCRRVILMAVPATSVLVVCLNGVTPWIFAPAAVWGLRVSAAAALEGQDSAKAVGRVLLVTCVPLAALRLLGQASWDVIGGGMGTSLAPGLDGLTQESGTLACLAIAVILGGCWIQIENSEKPYLLRPQEPDLVSMLAVSSFSIAVGESPLGRNNPGALLPIMLVALMTAGWSSKVPRRGVGTRRAVCATLFCALGGTAALIAGGAFWMAAIERANQRIHDWRSIVLTRGIADPDGIRLPRALVRSTVAMEDRNFFAHGGFEPASIHRALRRNLRSLSMKQGGSTITQQAARYAFVGKEKTILRKVEEAATAVVLERELSKRQIIALYVATADYGYGQVGAEAASDFYFSKPLTAIEWPEAIFLVSCVVEPPKDPRSLTRAMKRRRLVRNRLFSSLPAGTDEAAAIAEAAELLPVQLLRNPQCLRDLRSRPPLESQWDFYDVETPRRIYVNGIASRYRDHRNLGWTSLSGIR